MDPLELDLNNPDAQQTLYEDVLIRKKSIESLNSIVVKDEENWNDFKQMNNNNSFVLDPDPELKPQDKEMFFDVDMMDQSPVNSISVEEQFETEFNVLEG